MRAIPTINTAHATLRALRPQDFDQYVEIIAQNGMSSGSSAEDQGGAAWTSFLRNAGQWQVTGFGQWAIVPHGAAQVMGVVGFASSSQVALRHVQASCVLHPEAAENSVNKDAARAAHDWFDRVITGPLYWRVSPDDAATQQLADDNGYISGATPGLLERRAPPGHFGNLIGT